MVSEETKKRYWTVIKETRQSGRISPSVISRVEESWNKYDDDVVEEALNIHILRYRGYKENYTVGIMRNLQKKKAEGGAVKKPKNSFHNFNQRSNDYDELEKMLLTTSPPQEQK
ncbi:MAG: hypothetical protein J6K53_02810 [Roseburia sp.]|nr:hypothetical protein [Roseburia sp.]